jgi:serine protease
MSVRLRWCGAAALGAALQLGVLAGPPAQAAAVALSPCADPDNGDPVVTSVVLGAASVDTTGAPATVDVTVSATDAGGPGAPSGVERLTVYLAAANGATTPERPVVATAAAEGTWQARLTLPRGVQPGVYRPAVWVTDGAGNWASYGPGGTATPGDPAITVTSVPDVTPPRLQSLQLSATRVDTRRRAAEVTVTARATDAGAGVTRVIVYAVADRRRSTSTFLHRVKGSAQNGRWRGSLHIPRYMGDRTWRITAGVVDAVVNPRSYSPRALAVLDRDHHVDRSFVVRSRPDNARPTSSPATFSVSAVDATTGDQDVVVRVRARDDASGVARLRLRLLDPPETDGELDTYLHRVSGTRRNGVWQATVTIPQCGVAGTWSAQVEVTDRAGRGRQYLSGQPTLQVTTRDNVVPIVARAADAAGDPVLTFSEDVTGVTATSATAHDAAGAAVPGTWACADATGAVVSCATGALRRATFTPHPSAAGQIYLTLNPEGSLGVTDLAGNPVGRRRTV